MSLQTYLTIHWLVTRKNGRPTSDTVHAKMSQHFHLLAQLLSPRLTISSLPFLHLCNCKHAQTRERASWTQSTSVHVSVWSVALISAMSLQESVMQKTRVSPVRRFNDSFNDRAIGQWQSKSVKVSQSYKNCFKKKKNNNFYGRKTTLCCFSLVFHFSQRFQKHKNKRLLWFFNGLYLLLIITLYHSDYTTGEVGVCAQGHFDESKRGVNRAVNWCPVWCQEPLNCWDFRNMRGRFMNSVCHPTHTCVRADKAFAKSSKHLLTFPSSSPPRL